MSLTLLSGVISLLFEILRHLLLLCHCKIFFELFSHPIFLSLLSNTITEHSGLRSHPFSFARTSADIKKMGEVPSGTYLGASSAFLLCPLLFALVLFLNEFECPLTGRVVASHNRSTKLHKNLHTTKPGHLYVRCECKNTLFTLKLVSYS